MFTSLLSVCFVIVDVYTFYKVDFWTNVVVFTFHRCKHTTILLNLSKVMFNKYNNAIWKTK